MKRVTKRVIRSTIAAIALCGTLTAYDAISLVGNNIPYTAEDLANTGAYITEYQEIQETTPIVFQNQELLTYIEKQLGTEFTTSTLHKIKKLNIEDTLTNQDFSDLKYLTNLEELTIKNNTINLSDLKYNQDLKKLTLTGCEVTNTGDLPNSIESIALLATTITDDVLYIPYNTYYLYNYQSAYSTMHLKNPEKLSAVTVDSNLCQVDLSFINDCPNLLLLYLQYCPNVTNADALKNLPASCKVTLDDYSPIWLTEDIYNSLTNVEVEADNYSVSDIASETASLDALAKEIVPDESISDFDKIKAISNYMINHFTYSQTILDSMEPNPSEETVEEAGKVSDALNNYPIKYALDETDDIHEVCINYACFMQAIANRVGLKCDVLTSANHAWNLINDNYVDITTLDHTKFGYEGDDTRYTLEELLAQNKEFPDYIYYVDDENKNDEAYEVVYNFNASAPVTNNIGYVMKTSLDKNSTMSLTKQMLPYNITLSIAMILFINTIINLYNQVHSSSYDEDDYERLLKHHK